MNLRSPVTCETIEVCWECMGMPFYSLRNGLGWVFCKLYHKHVTHHPSLAKHGQTMSNQRNPFDIRVGGFEEIHDIPQRNAWYKSIDCTTQWSGWKDLQLDCSARLLLSLLLHARDLARRGGRFLCEIAGPLGRWFFSYVSYPFLHFISISKVEWLMCIEMYWIE